jgi:hypothetical protein
MAMDALIVYSSSLYIRRPVPRFGRELVDEKFSTSVRIASRSLALSARSAAEACGASAPSGCGWASCRHSVQYTLPGAWSTGLEQSSCWQRVTPPCATQSMPPITAALEQPSC